jgi:hypothetical protein
LFAAIKKNRAIPIQSVSNEHPAWVLRYDDWYGVGIPYEGQTISERFNSVKLWSNTIIIGKYETTLLLLTSKTESLRYEFASICAQFIDPGIDGIYRREITSRPAQWWMKWKSLLGNAVRDKESYSILAEVLVYEKLLDMGENPVWAAINHSTHDIELENCSYEVKSTISRYDTIVHINGQFQLQVDEKNLYLIFVRLEPSVNGQSIDDVLTRLASKGVGREILNDLNKGLEEYGLEKGCSARSEKYKLLEMKKYTVDKSFPAIRPEDFKNNQYPRHIRQITYSVELSGLPCENWFALTDKPNDGC